MNPSWVMVAIAAGGIIFQAGIGWAVVGRMSRIERKVDDHSGDIGKANAAIAQHEWRITNHDQRLHSHDQVLDRLRGRVVED